MNRFASRPGPWLWLAVLAVLLGGSPVQAQPANEVPFANDDHFFRFILEQLQVRALASISEAADDPAHSVLIVLGDTGSLEQVPGGVVKFVESGGALLIATNKWLDDDLSDALGVYISGKIVLVPEGGDQAYRKEPRCPLAVPVSGHLEPWHELAAVACNNPSYLFSNNPRLPMVARHPREWGIVDSNLDLIKSDDLALAAAGDWNKGRVLIVADPSIFNNEMMMQDDNNNFTLAYNVLQWLTDRGKRDRAILIDDGRIISDYQGVMAELSKPPLPPMEILNRMIAGMENDNFFNRFVLSNVRMWNIWRSVAAGLAIGLVLLGLHRLSQLRILPDAQRATAPAMPLEPALGLVDQRHQMMIARGNLYEGARDLCRQCFQSLGVRPAPAEDGAPPAPPRMTAQGSYREHKTLHDLTMRAWDVAYGLPRRVSPRQFARMVRELEEIRNAVRAGRLQLESARGQA